MCAVLATCCVVQVTYDTNKEIIEDQLPMIKTPSSFLPVVLSSKNLKIFVFSNQSIGGTTKKIFYGGSL